MSEDNADSCYGVVLSVVNEPGPDILMEQLFKAARDNKLETRESAMKLLCRFCEKSPADLSEHVPQLIVFTTEALNDPSDVVCVSAWTALEATVKVRCTVYYTFMLTYMYICTIAVPMELNACYSELILELCTDYALVL